MAWSIFFTAIGFVFVIEGMLPFLSPPFWRKCLERFFQQSDVSIRVFGLLSMLVGLALVCIAREF